jgi:hypothetical protein
MPHLEATLARLINLRTSFINGLDLQPQPHPLICSSATFYDIQLGNTCRALQIWIILKPFDNFYLGGLEPLSFTSGVFPTRCLSLVEFQFAVDMMERLRSLWSQYTAKTREYNTRYALLDSSSDVADHESELSDITEPKVLETAPSITWRINPTLSVSINLVEVRRRCKPFLLFILPNFLRARANKTPRKLYPTSYLDGLRGVAALFVVIHHYAYTFTASSLQGWHAGPEGSHNWFFQLPLIRVVHSGRFMVAIFFVISGYVLSYRSLKLAREGKQVELLDSLASSVFRRWLRLHLPVIVSTFIAFLAARADFWTDMHAGWEHDPLGTYLYPKPVALPTRQGTLVEQLWG